MSKILELIQLLGRDGAIAGLSASDLTVSELLEIASPHTTLPTKIKRDDLIRRIVDSERERLTKAPEELMEMDAETLRAYFSDVKLSRNELIELLASMDIRPGSAARNNLTEFAAREISDIGMYRRVAKGHGSLR